jgi:hypothetical protein
VKGSLITEKNFVQKQIVLLFEAVQHIGKKVSPVWSIIRLSLLQQLTYVRPERQSLTQHPPHCHVRDITQFPACPPCGFLWRNDAQTRSTVSPLGRLPELFFFAQIQPVSSNNFCHL